MSIPALYSLVLSHDRLGLNSRASKNALVKLLYCAYQRISEKWNQPMHNWALIISQLDIYFDGRLKVEL